ncbi:2-C-methyl-D-erythritol 4-phosphate cytidylyltransferase [Marinomonas ushuaiensis DSM 15871]|uniref:2-C-methyl-D-erythritol 4-phosphate cytidylyltransferase n=1 Tax=Marinomonas ushuaiensis DSM 15871 TaxID=1122207 RepID=X7E6D8_9GAMM|nr:2-C-methyl-D-erythritol 4-phosphate cytidylyltransferase [Marinomonas ushuaiensis]ETX10733.1 2-C-methyl-D-erythritol 4-phosphate cytidylyltransferase [Marinomonas ushuaiensis DSM 15871]
MTSSLWIIIPAAGVGQRMQAHCPKQYLSLAGQSILDRTIEIFVDHPLIAGVAVGVSPEDVYWSESKWYQHASVHTFSGGKERSDTVLKGLKFLAKMTGNEQQEVLVHDAARPLLTQKKLEQIIRHDSDQGVLLAMPARDTVKRQLPIDTSLACTSSVDITLDRSGIWLAQTPQKFVSGRLLYALEKAQTEGVVITDECSAMEFAGWHPDLLVGESSNIKVTFPEDLLIAEALFSYLRSSNLHFNK